MYSNVILIYIYTVSLFFFFFWRRRKGRGRLGTVPYICMYRCVELGILSWHLSKCIDEAMSSFCLLALEKCQNFAIVHKVYQEQKNQNKRQYHTFQTYQTVSLNLI